MVRDNAEDVAIRKSGETGVEKARVECRPADPHPPCVDFGVPEGPLDGNRARAMSKRYLLDLVSPSPIKVCVGDNAKQ